MEKEDEWVQTSCSIRAGGRLRDLVLDRAGAADAGRDRILVLLRKANGELRTAEARDSTAVQLTTGAGPRLEQGQKSQTKKNRAQQIAFAAGIRPSRAARNNRSARADSRTEAGDVQRRLVRVRARKEDGGSRRVRTRRLDRSRDVTCGAIWQQLGFSRIIPLGAPIASCPQRAICRYAVSKS